MKTTDTSRKTWPKERKKKNNGDVPAGKADEKKGVTLSKEGEKEER